MKKFYRTYLIVGRNPETNGIIAYVGKHDSVYEDPTKDPYRGNGSEIGKFKKKYGEYLLRIVWSHDHGDKLSQHNDEARMIEEMRTVFGDNLLNVSEVNKFEYTQDSIDTEIIPVESRKVVGAKGREVDKSRSDWSRKAKQIAPYWQNPLKRKLYDLWIGLGKCGNMRLAQESNRLLGTSFTSKSSLQALQKEFMNKGFVEPDA